MADAFAVVTLQHPVQFGDEQISVLEFRRPTGADFRAIRPAEGNYDLMLQFAARLTGLPDSVFDDLDGVDDVPKVVGVISRFLMPGQKTGQTSSGISEPSSTSQPQNS